MKFASSLCLVALFLVNTRSASYEPIWISPSNPSTDGESSNLIEDYSAGKGEWANLTNGAGSRFTPLAAMDSKGTIWIMLGIRLYAAAASKIPLFNVWNYNPKTDQYRYVWGDETTATQDPRSPGELRVPNINNHPGGSRYSIMTIDKSDNLWLYPSKSGGELWMFNTTSMMFTRMFGLTDDNNSPSIGANPGQPGEDVWPGYYEGQCMVADSQNNIWIIAGSNVHSNVNAVWLFNTTLNMWTFIYGSIDPIDEYHNATFYGGTWMPGCFIDENDRVWLYGGYGNRPGGSDDYGSLWSFDTRVTRKYELEYGANTFAIKPVSVSANYDVGNHPGAVEGSLLTDRLDGTLILVPTTGFNSLGDWGGLNQVWLFNKETKLWKLVHGDVETVDAAGAYTNYREAGSAMPGTIYPTVISTNTMGDGYIIGGAPNTFNGDVPGRKTIWLIPNDQCSSPTANKCDVNAKCTEEMFGYSCACNDGFTGDGFTCTGPPVAPPVNVPVEAPMTSPVSAPVASAPGTTPSKKVSDASSFIGSAAIISAVVIFAM